MKYPDETLAILLQNPEMKKILKNVANMMSKNPEIMRTFQASYQELSKRQTESQGSTLAKRSDADNINTLFQDVDNLDNYVKSQSDSNGLRFVIYDALIGLNTIAIGYIGYIGYKGLKRMQKLEREVRQAQQLDPIIPAGQELPPPMYNQQDEQTAQAALQAENV